jgi:GDPmannose 4,6-dehydratase
VQHDVGDDFVLATGETHSVREFVELAFAHVGRRVIWSGRGVDEIGTDAKSGMALVRVDKRYFRPTEVDLLLGNPAKALETLGWRHTTGFDELVKEMMQADLAAALCNGQT